MAHTIKGVAGSLGAGAVQAAAADLERAIKEGSSAAGALCDNLATVLSPLVAGLRVALGEPPSVKASEDQAAIDPAMIRETVVRMTRFLSEFDPAAVECLGSDGARFRALFDPATLSEFEQHVAGYAFTEAQALLDRAARDRGI
jgi:two-component system sensor histidine kinase/response regulator